MRIIERIKNFLKEDVEYKEDYIPSLELTPEKEEEIIEKITQKVEKYGMKTAALLFLRSYKPIGVYASQIAPTVFGPYFMLLDLFNIEGYNYNALFVKRENMDRLIKRIEQI